jgi:hypothetical protein
MPEEIREGTVVYEEGKYLLEVEGKREELPVGVRLQEAQLKKLVGQKVEVLYTVPRQYVVGLKGFRRPPILCYVPPIDWQIDLGLIRGVESQVRLNLAKQFLKANLITKEIYAKLGGKL